LGREAWVEAAIDELGVKGFRGLAVEPLARRIGISKGSFYWHFADLNDLVAAVVAAWKTAALDQVIAQLDQVADPKARLARLIHVAWDSRRHLRAEAALVSAALDGDRRISRVVKKVTNGRLAYLQAIYRQLGLTPVQAERWALTAYSAYVGSLQLMALEPKSLATEAAVRAHARHLEQVLIPN
jgi:AcrR family transcriptional regulator